MSTEIGELKNGGRNQEIEEWGSQSGVQTSKREIRKWKGEGGNQKIEGRRLKKPDRRREAENKRLKKGD
jgi:hypothetical protein